MYKNDKPKIDGIFITHSHPDHYLDILKPQIKHIHASGHAYIKGLQEFVQKIEPKVIIPIHTDSPERYSGLYDAEIKVLNDGEVLNL